MFDEKSHSLKMDKAIEVFSKELSSLRTGRANSAMLDLVKVDVYGQHMPINQIASITTPEPRINFLEFSGSIFFNKVTTFRYDRLFIIQSSLQFFFAFKLLWTVIADIL